MSAGKLAVFKQRGVGVETMYTRFGFYRRGTWAIIEIIHVPHQDCAFLLF